MQQAVPEQVRGRLVARKEQENAVRHHLVLAQHRTAVLRREHQGNQIVFLSSTRTDEDAEIVDDVLQPGPGASDVVASLLRAADVRRDLVGPRLEERQIGDRNPEHHPDDGRGERKREIRDEIHRPLAGGTI